MSKTVRWNENQQDEWERQCARRAHKMKRTKHIEKEAIERLLEQVQQEEEWDNYSDDGYDR